HGFVFVGRDVHLIAEKGDRADRSGFRDLGGSLIEEAAKIAARGEKQQREETDGGDFVHGAESGCETRHVPKYLRAGEAHYTLDFLTRILGGHQVADDRGAGGAGLPDLRDVLLVDAADRDDGNFYRVADLAQHRKPARGMARSFRRSREDRAEAD